MDSTPKPTRDASAFKDYRQRQRIYNSNRKGIEKAILVHLLHNGNEGTYEKTGVIQAWPKLETMEREIGFDEKTIRNALKRLRADGIVQWCGAQNAKGQFDYNRYTLNLDRLTVTQTNEPSAFSTDGEVLPPESLTHGHGDHRRNLLPPPSAFGTGDRRHLVPPPSESLADKQASQHAIETGYSNMGTRNADEPNHQIEAPALENAERSEAVSVAPVRESSAPPVSRTDGEAVPPGPPIPEPEPAAPIPPEPPKWCSEGSCEQIALQGDHLCAAHRAEHQGAAVQRMRALLAGPRDADAACSVDGCNRPANAIDRDRLCDVHRNERKHQEQRERLRRQRSAAASPKTCVKDGCTRSVVGPYGAPYDTLCNDHLEAQV